MSRAGFILTSGCLVLPDSSRAEQREQRERKQRVPGSLPPPRKTLVLLN